MRSFILLIVIATLLITGQAVQVRSRRQTSTVVAPPEPKRQEKPTPPAIPWPP